MRNKKIRENDQIFLAYILCVGIKLWVSFIEDRMMLMMFNFEI